MNFSDDNNPTGSQLPRSCSLEGMEINAEIVTANMFMSYKLQSSH